MGVFSKYCLRLDSSEAELGMRFHWESNFTKNSFRESWYGVRKWDGEEGRRLEVKQGWSKAPGRTALAQASGGVVELIPNSCHCQGQRKKVEPLYSHLHQSLLKDCPC